MNNFLIRKKVPYAPNLKNFNIFNGYLHNGKVIRHFKPTKLQIMTLTP